MTEILPCLLRVGENVKKHKVFKLDRKQVTIGRSLEVTYAILSNVISRCHAIVKQQDDNSWTITDNKSLNGVFVNDQKLSPMTPYTLQEGDVVQFGVPVTPDVPAEFIYRFHSALKVRIEKKGKKMKTEHPLINEKATLSLSESSECDEDREQKRKTRMFKSQDDSPRKQLQQQMEQAQQEQAAKEAEYQSKLAEMEKLLKEKEQEQLQVQQQLLKERQEKENQAKEVEELKTSILLEMEDQQKRLEQEKEELRLKMQTELETSLKEREAALLAQLNAQRDVVINEKKQIEESLQREMEKALEEKDKELEQNLLEQKQKLEKVLEKKEMEQKVLEAQLNETKEKSETHALQAKEEILSNFVDLMEMELQCSVCNELFIKATSLNCSHTFCKLCINQWLKRKNECPNCRKPVTSQMQAIALDNYIDKMVEQLNDELKTRRKELVAQRKVEQEQFDSQVPGTSANGRPANNPLLIRAPIAVAGGTVRGAPRGARTSTRTTRGRGRGAARANNAQAAATLTSTGPAQTSTTTLSSAAPSTTGGTTGTVIELSDDNDDDDDFPAAASFTTTTTTTTTSSDDSSEGEDNQPYYGGYGRCFKCGLGGHWANGCPF